MLLVGEITICEAGVNQYLLEQRNLSSLAIHRHLGNQKQVTEQERKTTDTEIKCRRLRLFSEIISGLHKVLVEEVNYSASQRSWGTELMVTETLKA